MATSEKLKRRTFSSGKESRHMRSFLSTVASAGDTGTAIAEVKVHPACPLEVIADGYTLKKRNFECEEIEGTNKLMTVVTWSHLDANPGSNQNDNLLEPGDVEKSWRFTGREVTRSFAESQTAYGPAPPAIGNAINVDDKGNPKGVGVLESHGVFTIEQIVPESWVTNAWIRKRGQKVGKKNSDTIYSYEPGELLFTEFVGRRQNSGNWKVTTSYEISENETDFDVSGITVAEKKGWDYLHIYAQKQEDETANVIVPEVLGVYVAQVVKDTTFADIFQEDT